MKSKKVVFALNTEFCLLVALQYLDKYLDDSYEPVWVLLKTKERFSFVNLDALPGKVIPVLDEFNTRKLVIDTGWLNQFEKLKVEFFVLQNNYKVSSLALFAVLRKTNSELKTVFISDSIALETTPSKRTIVVSNIYLNFRRLLNRLHGLPLLIIPAKQYLRQVNSYISKRQHADVDAPFIAFEEVLGGLGDHKLCDNVFPIEFSDTYDVYLFSQPILEHQSFSENTKKQYIRVLELVSLLAQKHQTSVLIKVHPSEAVEAYLQYANEFCHVLKNTSVPAEILFSKIKNKTIISCFSSVSTLDFSEGNKHFWFYPMVNHFPDFRSEEKYIKVLESFYDLENLVFEFKQ